MTESLLATFQQWLLFVGAVIAVGCVAWRLVLVPRVRREVAAPVSSHLPSIERAAAGMGLLATLVIVVAWSLRMVVQVRGFRDEFVPLWEDVSFLLFETFWGTNWMMQGAVITLLIGAFAWARTGSDLAWRVAGVLVIGLVATLALASHAMGVESGKFLFVTADAVHALAAGCWVGSLFIVVTLGRPSGGGAEARTLFAAQLRAFSPLAQVSVAALIGMGVTLAWTHIGALSNLWTTGYGRVLVAKVTLAGAVFLAGLINWKRGLAVMETEDRAAAIHRRSVVEVSLATVVLLLTAVLVHSVKP